MFLDARGRPGRRGRNRAAPAEDYQVGHTGDGSCARIDGYPVPVAWCSVTAARRSDSSRRARSSRRSATWPTSMSKTSPDVGRPARPRRIRRRARWTTRTRACARRSSAASSPPCACWSTGAETDVPVLGGKPPGDRHPRGPWAKSPRSAWTTRVAGECVRRVPGGPRRACDAPAASPPGVVDGCADPHGRGGRVPQAWRLGAEGEAWGGVLLGAAQELPADLAYARPVRDLRRWALGDGRVIGPICDSSAEDFP